MVSGVESTFLEKKTGDLLCSLVQLVAGETLAASSSIVEKSEQVVVGRCLSDYIAGKILCLWIYLRSPSEDLGNELILLSPSSNVSGLILEPTDVPAGSRGKSVALDEVADYHRGWTHVAVNLPRFW